ncbi:MAG: prohibitin family protein [Deltaproteobacteria bacterium]|jgi:regulator of protease activity HflC (stomatin/prohibitin superfamily)|nr:prohibitin family protein [Deltaproteobacteria bacterium]
MSNDDRVDRGNAGSTAAGRSRRGDFWAKRKKSLFWWALFVALFLIVLWPTVVVTILPGHVGVLYRRFMGGTELNRTFQEGTHVIFPWDTMHVFDSRLHEETHTVDILNVRGLQMELDVSIIYHPLADRTPTLLSTVGLEYREKLIIPMLTSSVREISAKYDTDDFFSTDASRISDEMLVLMIGTMGRNPVVVDNLMIRRVRLPNSLAEAINSKLVAQQKIFEQQFNVLEAVEAYKRKYVEASAVSMTQEIVNARMSEPFLRWQGIEATRALAASGNSKVVLFGGPDGLPIILNMEGSGQRLDQESALEPDLVSEAPSETRIDSAETVGAAEPSTSTSTSETVGSEESWLERIGPERLESISRTMERAIGLPLYNHGPAPALGDRNGGDS